MVLRSRIALNGLAAASLLLAVSTIGSAVYLRGRGAPSEWRGEIDCGTRPLTASEAATTGDRVTLWAWSAFGASVGQEAAFGFHDDGTRTGNAILLPCVVVPLWLPAVLSVPMPIAWFVARHRDRIAKARLARGACGVCGYDLRATVEGRCPECGAATK